MANQKDLDSVIKLYERRVAHRRRELIREMRNLALVLTSVAENLEKHPETSWVGSHGVIQSHGIDTHCADYVAMCDALEHLKTLKE